MEQKNSAFKKVVEAFLEVIMLSLTFAIVSQVFYDNTEWYQVTGGTMFFIALGFLGTGYAVTGLLPFIKKERVQE